jgi:triphosphoribosyl-dephospho-CoA synthase
MSRIARLVQAACLLEASAAKPGNVHPGRDFADTNFEDFLLSAVAIGPAFAREDGAVGETVLAAVRETRIHVATNTNLGMILLLAPLARAAANADGTLRERVRKVLAATTVEDARAVYAAIRLAAPGGLGKADEQDVSGEPTLTLRDAMTLAAERDSVAREYATDYDVTFRLGVPALRRARSAGFGWRAAAVESYLEVLAEVPDTLVARKGGVAVAQAISARAREVLGTAGAARAQALEAFDAELRAKGNRLNPGTTADLVAAALFVALEAEG